MHGKSVTLFDFERENENELPLVKGQFIWVSYRHGQGWLVAEDPQTGESGLVPEEYVRLLREIQGGWNGLSGQTNAQLPSPVATDAGTPTQPEHCHIVGHPSVSSHKSNEYQHSTVSTFSASSKDLHPYPQNLLGEDSKIKYSEPEVKPEEFSSLESWFTVEKQKGDPGFDILSNFLSERNVRAVKLIIENHFESVAKNKFEWIGDLKEAGCSNDQIVNALLESTKSSPWVLLAPRTRRSLRRIPIARLFLITFQ